MRTDDLKSARILVLDDDPVSLTVVAMVLGSLGFDNLLLLNDSTQIFQSLEEFRPDLVITDLEMPGVDGLQVIELVQQMTTPGEILPVLVVTAHGSTMKKRQALNLGAMDFLSKPCDPPELQARVQNLLRMRALQQTTQDYSQNLEQTVAERTQALEQALADLKESQRMMLHEERLRAFAQMAGGVVHDFNNTLMTITGYSLMLLREPALLADREEALRTLNIIHTAASDGARVVERLRDFYAARDAKEEAGNVDLHQLIRDVVELTRPKWHGQALAEGRRIDFEFDLQPVPAIVGRVAEVREVITNLIFNAVDAMPSGGRISCGARRRGAQVVLEIVDTGTGMSPEVRKHCLEAFFTTKGEHGTGLGLAMVAGIVQRHSGKLEIESEPGAGTLVRITLPAGGALEPPAHEPAAAESRPLRILVVDDDAHMRNVVTRLLAREGHAVVHASNGAEALEHVERERFDLLLTDHAMPGMNGIELASLMRSVDPEQRIVLFTGYPIPASETPDDVCCVLRKPVEASELQAAITRVMAA